VLYRAAIQFGILSNLEKSYRDRQREALRRGRAPPYVNEQMRLVMNGTLASTVAGVVCLPLETARRQMQVDTPPPHKKEKYALQKIRLYFVVIDYLRC
jgi:hypothetical protein